VITWADPAKHNFIFRHLADKENLSGRFSFFPYDVSTYADTTQKLSDIQLFINEQHAIGKRTVLLFGHDSDHPISEFLQGSPIVFRYSMSKNFVYKDEYSIPYGVRKFKESVQIINASPWSIRPKVTFMGWATPPNPKMYELSHDEKTEVKGLVSPEVFKTPANLGLVLRKKALSFLADDSRIDTEFKLNDTFYLQHNLEMRPKMFQEYIQLMRNGHYVVALRGCGNYSIRLFETLAADRIPIMVDTNQYLPFEDKINWKELGVWIPLEKFSSISDLVVDYHNTGGGTGFQKRIETISDVYNKYLSRDASLRIIESIIESHL